MGRLIALMLLAAPVAADTPLTAAEFEAYVEGRTMSYATGGVAYGAETYLQGRRVLWSHLDGDCEEGRWYSRGEDVCFVYDGLDSPQCWQFFLRGDALVADFRNTVSGQLYEIEALRDPLQCFGLNVGV